MASATGLDIQDFFSFLFCTSHFNYKAKMVLELISKTMTCMLSVDALLLRPVVVPEAQGPFLRKTPPIPVSTTSANLWRVLRRRGGGHFDR